MVFGITALVVSLSIIVLELLTGFALIGWTGDSMLVERAKSPGPYWFAIVLHAAIGIALPLLFLLAE